MGHRERSRRVCSSDSAATVTQTDPRQSSCDVTDIPCSATSGGTGERNATLHNTQAEVVHCATTASTPGDSHLSTSTDQRWTVSPLKSASRSAIASPTNKGFRNALLKRPHEPCCGCEGLCVKKLKLSNAQAISIADRTSNFHGAHGKLIAECSCQHAESSGQSGDLPSFPECLWSDVAESSDHAATDGTHYEDVEIHAALYQDSDETLAGVEMIEESPTSIPNSFTAINTPTDQSAPGQYTTAGNSNVFTGINVSCCYEEEGHSAASSTDDPNGHENEASSVNSQAVAHPSVGISHNRVMSAAERLWKPKDIQSSPLSRERSYLLGPTKRSKKSS